jgi:hypothetical protein
LEAFPKTEKIQDKIKIGTTTIKKNLKKNKKI